MSQTWRRQPSLSVLLYHGAGDNSCKGVLEQQCVRSEAWTGPMPTTARVIPNLLPRVTWGMTWLLCCRWLWLRFVVSKASLQSESRAGTWIQLTRPTLVHQRGMMFTEQEAGSSHGRCYVVKTHCLRPRWRGAATRWRLNVRLGRSFMAAVTKEKFVCTRRWKGILFANLWRRAKQISEGLELKKNGQTLGKGHSGLARGGYTQSPSLSAWSFILGCGQAGTLMAEPPL